MSKYITEVVFHARKVIINYETSSDWLLKN